MRVTGSWTDEQCRMFLEGYKEKIAAHCVKLNIPIPTFEKEEDFFLPPDPPKEKPIQAKKAIIEIDNCLDCPDHIVDEDPDPHDWFCDDDKKVLCRHNNTEKVVTCACRPYNLRSESVIPPWCPRICGGSTYA